MTRPAWLLAWTMFGATSIGMLSLVGCANGTAADGSVDDAHDADADANDAPTGDPCATVGGEGRIERRIVRLSRDEYAAAVAVVLGPRVGARAREIAQGLPVDVVERGFDARDALSVNDLLAEKLQQAAEELAGLAVDDSAEFAALQASAGCAGAGRACAEHIAQHIGRRALRRPPDVDELAGLLVVYDAAAQEVAAQGTIGAQAAYVEGVRWLLTSLLQLPGFVYKEELGVQRSAGVFALTSWEQAAALSFAFLGAPPDDTLLDVVASGHFDVDTTIAQLRVDPRAVAHAQRFFGAWLDLDSVVRTPHDAATFPELTPALVGAVRAQPDADVADAVRAGRSLRDLLTGTTTRIGPALAAYYGVPAPDASGVVSLDDSGYRGLLSMGAFTAGHSLPTESAPVRRGAAVRARVLCDPLPPPPPNVNAAPPPQDPTASTRERFAAHSRVPECRGCHDRVDGIGFALEAFDGKGVRRAVDHGRDVDVRGRVVDVDGRDADVVDVQGLAALLGDSAQVGRCYMDSWTRFAAGIDPDAIGCPLHVPATTAPLLDAPASLAPLFIARVGVSSSPDGFALPVDAAQAEGEGEGEGDAVDSGEGEGEGSGDVAGAVIVTTREVDRWTTGACYSGDVDNGSSAAVPWETIVDLEGVLVDHWNSELDELGPARVRFRGAAWNATLPPGFHSDVFGYCVSF